MPGMQTGGSALFSALRLFFLILVAWTLRVSPPRYEGDFALQTIGIFVMSNALSLFITVRISVGLVNNSAVGATLIWGYPWARDWVNDRVLELKALATSAPMSPTASSKLNDTVKPAGLEDEERKEMTVGEYRALIRGASTMDWCFSSMAASLIALCTFSPCVDMGWPSALRLHLFILLALVLRTSPAWLVWNYGVWTFVLVNVLTIANLNWTTEKEFSSPLLQVLVSALMLNNVAFYAAVLLGSAQATSWLSDRIRKMFQRMNVSSDADQGNLSSLVSTPEERGKPEFV
ncbi:hypothetical protein C8F01DRAFT_1260121 [Mycena amicta]|nr:hypothetical protein C8F01DRAFT_1260121 [Mycena amicta]